MLRYEDAAEVRTVSGWACKKCHRFWGDDEQAERFARRCCSDDRPCERCGGRNLGRSWTCCEDCRHGLEVERFLARERVEWDGSFPVAINGDEHVFDDGILLDRLVEQLNGGTPIELIEVCTCERVEPRGIDLHEFWSDELPTERDYDFAEAEKRIDEILRATFPEVWMTTGTPITVQSIIDFLGDDMPKGGAS